MLILGLETSGQIASVALSDKSGLIAEYSACKTRAHSETILPMAQMLMREFGFMPHDIKALSVNCGPGSFTGVRIGICIANALGAALNIPVVGVDSLSALCENALWPHEVCVMLDARNENGYMARFLNGEIISPPKADKVENFLCSVPEKTLFIGDGALAYKGLITAKVRDAVIAPSSFSIKRAGSLCSLAQKKLAASKEAPMQAVPLYLRQSQAERLWSLKREDAVHG